MLRTARTRITTANQQHCRSNTEVVPHLYDCNLPAEGDNKQAKPAAKAVNKNNCEGCRNNTVIFCMNEAENTMSWHQKSSILHEGNNIKEK